MCCSGKCCFLCFFQFCKFVNEKQQKVRSIVPSTNDKSVYSVIYRIRMHSITFCFASMCLGGSNKRRQFIHLSISFATRWCRESHQIREKKWRQNKCCERWGEGGWEQEKKKFGDEKSGEIEAQNHLTDQMSRRPVHVVWMMVDVSGTGYGGNSILYPLYDMSNNTPPTWIKTNLRFIMKTNAWWSIAIVAQFLFRFSPECMLPTCDRRRY